jgi:hypothetical protein
MEPIEVVRIFNGSDAFMTESARVIHDLFATDIAAFTAFDSTLNGAFVTAYLAEVVAAEQVIADTAIVDQQVILTEKADKSMDLARIKYNEVKYFVQKAFKDSLGTQNEFGLNDYERARKNKSQMAQFLFEMHVAADKYGAELIAAGYNQAGIDAILPLRDELLTNNISQKVFQKQRPKLTEDRVKVLNTCYKTMMQINAAAQIVFIDDFAKQNQYVYMPSSEQDDSLEFIGVAPIDTVTLIGTVDYLATAIVRFRNTGLASLTFSLSQTLDIESNAIELNGGAEVTKTMGELQVDGINLLVKNNDATQEGNYLVEVDY